MTRKWCVCILNARTGTNDREEAAEDRNESDAEEVTEKVNKKRRVGGISRQ